MVQGRKMTNYGPNEILDLITSFERYFLSFQKIITFLKLDQRNLSYGC